MASPAGAKQSVAMLSLSLLLWLVGWWEGMMVYVARPEARSSRCPPGNEYHEVLQQPLRALEEELLPVSTMGISRGKITNGFNEKMMP